MARYRAGRQLDGRQTAGACPRPDPQPQTPNSWELGAGGKGQSKGEATQRLSRRAREHNRSIRTFFPQIATFLACQMRFPLDFIVSLCILAQRLKVKGQLIRF